MSLIDPHSQWERLQLRLGMVNVQLQFFPKRTQTCTARPPARNINLIFILKRQQRLPPAS